MSFIRAIVSGFRNYLNFSGRANRREFWYWIGFAALAWLLLLWVDLNFVGPWQGYLPMEDGAPRPLSWGWLALVVLPTLSVLVRRVHDHNQPGWMALTVLPLPWWLIVRGTKGENRYG